MLKIKEVKNATLQIRLTEEEKQTIKDAAEKRSLSVSDYLKYCVNKDLQNDKEV